MSATAYDGENVEAVIANLEEGDVLHLRDRERGRRRHEDCEAEYEVYKRVNPYKVGVKRVDGGGRATMQSHATGPGVRLLTSNTDPGVVWHEWGVEWKEENDD